MRFGAPREQSLDLLRQRYSPQFLSLFSLLSPLSLPASQWRNLPNYLGNCRLTFVLPRPLQISRRADRISPRSLLPTPASRRSFSRSLKRWGQRLTCLEG